MFSLLGLSFSMKRQNNLSSVVLHQPWRYQQCLIMMMLKWKLSGRYHFISFIVVKKFFKIKCEILTVGYYNIIKSNIQLHTGKQIQTKNSYRIINKTIYIKNITNIITITEKYLLDTARALSSIHSI